jgi:hypothetical protein
MPLAVSLTSEVCCLNIQSIVLLYVSVAAESFRDNDISTFMLPLHVLVKVVVKFMGYRSASDVFSKVRMGFLII